MASGRAEMRSAGERNDESENIAAAAAALEKSPFVMGDRISRR